MALKVFRHQHLQLSYYRYGKGKTVFLAFHGFGRTGEDFKPLADLLGEGYSVFAVNLFFHEGSSAPAERLHTSPLTKDEWQRLIRAFFEEHALTRVGLVGYSLGGRMVLTLYEAMPERINRLLLFAPDGLKMNWWYRLVSKSRLGKRIYHHIINDPKILFRLADAGQSVRLVDSKLKKFIRIQMDTREKRQRVYDIWLFYRLLFPDMKAVLANMEFCQTPAAVFFGRYDTIIPPAQARILGSGQTATIHLLDAGHQLMTERCFSEALSAAGIETRRSD